MEPHEHADQTRVLVVGAAIVRDGRVLAARRSQPPAVAGGWEFPGGKVDPGETPERALRRECREELGVEIALGERIGPDVRFGTAHLLRVWIATLVAGEPEPLEDHDLLRWLSRAELDAVPWLPADRPIVAALASWDGRLDV